MRLWQCRELGIKVDGVHIGQDDMAPEQARALLGPDAIIGLSAETLPHIEAANALPSGTIDYIGAGPLHYTATKPDAAAVEADGTKHALGIAGAQLLCEASRYPVVVGGGVHADDVPALARTAADGWFVVSAIAAADDPERATRELVQHGPPCGPPGTALRRRRPPIRNRMWPLPCNAVPPCSTSSNRTACRRC